MNIDMDLSETQVIKDNNPFRMARLLQGDVGSGKTLTAFFLALRAIDTGGQVAILAPTEILSKQHAENASKILEPLNVRIAFLTGNINTAGLMFATGVLRPIAAIMGEALLLILVLIAL